MNVITILTRFDSLSVRSKILAGYAALMIPLLVLMIMAGIMSLRILSLSQEINDDTIPALQALESIRDAGVRVIETTNTFALTTAIAGNQESGSTASDKHLVELRAARERFSSAVEAFERVGDVDGGGHDTFHRNITFARNDILLQSDRLAQIGEAGTAASVLLNLREHFESSAAQFRALIRAAIDAERTELAQRQDGLIRYIYLFAVFGIGFGFVGIGLAIVGGLRVSERIAQPIRRLRDAAMSIGEGNLDVPEQPQTGDEVGELVTAFRMMVERLQESMVKLARQERLATLGQLAGTVSHELRNPLGVIRNSMFSLRDCVGEDRADGADKLIDRIERNIGRCNNIVTDLLDFTRCGEVRPSPVDVGQCITAILDEHVLPPGITLQRDIAFGRTVSLDAERFRQVVINLLDNAAQAILDPAWQRSGPKENRIVVRSRVAGPHYELSIADTGPGIPTRTLPMIFEPLFTTKSFGVGLGLPMVRQIVQQHGGTIDVTSAEGTGTTFVIRLPPASREREKAA